MAGKQFHICCAPGDVGEYVFLPGNPGRVPKIAERLENAHFVAQNREFVTYTGFLNGIETSVTSTGIGGPSAAIAMEELVALGARTFIRIGTCGGMQEDIPPGTLILPTGAIRMEGTTREYLPLPFPAVPDFAVLSALVWAAKESAAPFRTGVVHCKDSFYGQHAPKSMPVGAALQENWEAWKKGGALGSEMESAALFVVAAARRVRCGTVLQMIWNQERSALARTHEEAQEDMSAAISVALGAMGRLMEIDKKRSLRNDNKGV